MVEFTRPRTAQQAVLEALRRMIVTGEIPPGATIRQDQLADQFGMSRVPVREALRILEGEGKVQHTAHQGYRVVRLSLDELLEVYRLRGLLETETAGQAVPRLSSADLDRMRSAMDAMDAAADAKDIIALGIANHDFHFAILEPSGMSLSLRIIGQLWETTDPYRRLYFTKPINRETVNSEHALILEACRDRDVERTLKLLDVHRSHPVEDLLALGESW